MWSMQCSHISTYCFQHAYLLFIGSTTTKETNNYDKGSSTNQYIACCGVIMTWQLHVITELNASPNTHNKQATSCKLNRLCSKLRASLGREGILHIKTMWKPQNDFVSLWIRLVNFNYSIIIWVVNLHEFLSCMQLTLDPESKLSLQMTTSTTFGPLISNLFIFWPWGNIDYSSVLLLL